MLGIVGECTATTGTTAAPTADTERDPPPSWEEVLERNNELAQAAGVEDEAADESDDYKLRSDITDDAHPNRTAEYGMVIATKGGDPDSALVDQQEWIVDGFNMSKELNDARLSCLDVCCKEMSDVRLLQVILLNMTLTNYASNNRMLNNIFLFDHHNTANCIIKYLNVHDENDFEMYDIIRVIAKVY